MSDLGEGKQRHRAVFAALQMQVRASGGFAALARQLGKNEQVFATKFNPNEDRHQPSAVEMLDVIELVGADMAANAIAMKVGRIAIEQEAATLSPRELVQRCQKMLAACGKTIEQTAIGIADGHLASTERDAIATCLDELIPILVGIRAAARS